ncbi:MAG: DUF2911 domain-containing protein [Cytophagales bacterium]|jgi:hypothetical protein|nr:DUF2911 domain-containing protein [Cytophagales bacterium]
MKKIVRIGLIVVAVLVVAFFALRTYTKSKSPEATAVFNENGLSVEVKYCQPAKKGREIFGGLLPYGKVWRTGANEATVISFGKDVLLADKPLKAGKYTLWTIPNPAEWTIVINGETGQWGTNYDESQDVLRVNVPVSKKSDVTELFKIDFTSQTGGADMVLRWDMTEVAVPVRVP